MNTRPIPAIFDTDIGYDIDDTWALALLLRSPELDLKLAVSDTQHTRYEAAILAKVLEVAGRTDVPVGVGIEQHRKAGGQLAWVEGYELASYPGAVSDDGVGAIIETIMSATEPVALICTGPVPNIAAALEREPRIAERARFVGMHGSVRMGYDGSPQVSAEYNVKADPAALRRVFAAPWEVTITPVDTCGLVTLKGEKYRRVLESRDPLARAVIENYRAWARHGGRPETADERSSTLFDTVAVYLAFSSELLKMEKLGLAVTDDGFTVIDETARPVNCAMEWKDLPAFEELLVQRLTAP
ncbi:MAG: nucleoside hydrolase [Armatimonadota bacterium]